MSYATPGTGTGTHLAGEILSSKAGIRLLHIPYKGSAPAKQDMIGGRVPLLFDVLFSSMPFVKDNRMKVIALSSDTQERAQQMAKDWGARWVDHGHAGHINAASALGDWPQGRALLQTFLKD